MQLEKECERMQGAAAVGRAMLSVHGDRSVRRRQRRGQAAASERGGRWQCVARFAPRASAGRGPVARARRQRRGSVSAPRLPLGPRGRRDRLAAWRIGQQGGRPARLRVPHFKPESG